VNAPTPDLLAASVKGVAALGLLLGGLFLAYRVVRHLGQRSSGSGKLIRVLATSYVGVKKTVSLVEIPGAVLVLGISGDRMRLLSTIRDPEVLAGLKADKAMSPPGLAFAGHLQRIMSRKGPTAGDPMRPEGEVETKLPDQ
jgi:flagellar biogenesis protein FliO